MGVRETEKRLGQICGLQNIGVGLLACSLVIWICGTVTDSPRVSVSLEILNVTTSSETDRSHLLIDGNPSTYWSSSQLPSPGRRQWVKIRLGGHWVLDALILTPSPGGGFPSGFEVFYSTDGGNVWYPVGGASFSGYPDPGRQQVRIPLHSVVADALMVQANYLRMDSLGSYTFQLAELGVEGSKEAGPFFTSRGGSWDADLNMMWRVFGSASDGTSAVPPIGGESAWMEWNALKLCWFKDDSLRQLLRDRFLNYQVGPDGYVWSWGDQEGWPTHGHRHYDSNPKYILGASRYYLWSGDEEFLQLRASPTVDMSLAIEYEGSEPVRWDSASHVAIRLEKGRTIGQTFQAQRSFTAVGGSFPTYLTSGSAMVLRLLKDGPGGEVVAASRFPNVVDNAWVMLRFDPRPPGRYYLEMCCPEGMIGWWSIGDDVIGGGEAYRDGVIVQRDSRTLLERLRAAMEFQLGELNGSSGLVVIRDRESNGTWNGFPTDYWDNFPFGYQSAYANIYFYASLDLMAEVEEAVGNLARAAELRDIRLLVKRRFNEVFWDEGKGRYVGCVDVQGVAHDYGFTYVNVEAAAYGLADEEKVRRIYSWLDGLREVPGDYARGGEIYSYLVAPRSTTIPVESVKPYWWYDIHGAVSVGPGGNANYGEHLENGGIIFYTSFYDVLSRLLLISPDDALKRLDVIMKEFHKDQLRRDPTNNKGIAWKLGIIGEFPESGLVPSLPVHGFLGADARCDGLHVSPRLPSNLSYMGVRDLWFRGILYTINVTRAEQNATISARPGGYYVSIPNGKHVLIANGAVRELGVVEPPAKIPERWVPTLLGFLIPWISRISLRKRGRGPGKAVGRRRLRRWGTDRSASALPLCP